MAQTTDHMQQYLDHFARFEKSLNGQANSAVHALRRDGIARFADLGLPTTRDEAWRFTNLASIARTDFAPAAPRKLATAALTPFLFPGLDGIELVFVNGHYVDELSTQGVLPAGVKVANLAAALENDADLVATHLGRRSAGDDQAFAALNTAFIRDGAFIYLPQDAVLDQPVHLLFLSSAGDAPTISHPRNLIVAEANSRATIVESYAGADGQVYLTNALTEVVAGEGAALDHYKIQRESRTAFHLANMQVYSERAANFTSTSASLGGRLARHDIHAQLAGEGAETTLNGLYLVDGEQHVDNYTLLEHTQPHCPSHEFYKGILDGRATGSFRGKIHVHREAQKTNAYQSNQNLLLSEDAQINSKPQLEIYADDVKCSHGSTVGQLDPDAVFYLRSRGLAEELAVAVLTQAFAGEVLERIQVDPVRRKLEELVDHQLTANRKNRGAQ